MTDPALQQVLDAFDATSLPRPPIRKVSGLDTPGAFKLLGAFEKYLDRVGDPVVNGVRTILAELRDRSFESIDVDPCICGQGSVDFGSCRLRGRLSLLFGAGSAGRGDEQALARRARSA
ncbi:MAG: hypothetical protein U0746_10220 [Gemmataceae bacterium]